MSGPRGAPRAGDDPELVRLYGTVFIVIDGEQKKDTDECIVAAKWLTFQVR